jgi:ribosomal protein S27AE
MVVTSPEQEKELHAYQCKNCGSTIFIARHREWFFKGGNTECTNCGAKGTENFEDIRENVIEDIDDDYFDYPSPLDYVSAAERRRLVKEAGGDEELAKKRAIEKALKEDPKQIQVEPSASSGDSGGEKKKNKKKSAGKKNASTEEKSEPKTEAPKKAPPRKKSDDILAELDMDAF